MALHGVKPKGGSSKEKENVKVSKEQEAGVMKRFEQLRKQKRA